MRFALEAPRQCLARLPALPEHAAAYELDRGRACQQAVLGPPYFTHAAFAYPFDQLVAADLTRIRQLRLKRWTTRAIT